MTDREMLYGLLGTLRTLRDRGRVSNAELSTLVGMVAGHISSTTNKESWLQNRCDDLEKDLREESERAGRIVQRLIAITEARDEACRIAINLLNGIGVGISASEQIRELREVGKMTLAEIEALAKN